MRDVGLLLIHDAAEPETWLHIWAHSYPETAQVFVDATQSPDVWQTQIQAACAHLHTEQVAIVAHGVGVAAALAWYDSLHMAKYRDLAAILLVAPVQAAFSDDMADIAQRTRFAPKTALVCGDDDALCPQTWAQQMAELWQARLFVLPHKGHLNQAQNGFEWGMKLLQEMIL